MTEQVRDIAIEELVKSAFNPRADVGDVSELAASIREHGVLEPIRVRPVSGNGHFEIVAGQRRVAASKLAGEKTIPAIVREMSDDEAEIISLTENLQRTDLNAIEEAQGYAKWLEIQGKAGKKVTHDDLAKAVGKKRSTVTNALRLLEAPEPVRQAVENRTLTAAGARVVLSVPEAARDLIDLTTEHSVAELQEQASKAGRAAPAVKKLRAAVDAARAAGKVITWDERFMKEDGGIYIGGADIDLGRLFGKPEKKLAGILHWNNVSVATHDAVCDCDAAAIDSQGRIEKACVSPEGWKKAVAKSRSAERSFSPAKKKKVQSKKQQEARLRAVIAQSVKEAAKAVTGGSLRSWSGMTTKVEPRYAKGGILGEPARLVLFGLLAKYSDARGPMWKLELWKKIETMPLAKVRKDITRYLLGLAFREIADASRYQDKYGNTKKIRALVNAHYGVRVKAKKAAR